MKASIFCAAVAGVMCLAASASAQQPGPAQAGCYNGQPGAHPSYGAPINGSYGDYGNASHGNQCLPDCDDCSEPGRCKQWLQRCMAKIHACFARKHQIASPTFKTHPFARSPRDYFMYD